MFIGQYQHSIDEKGRVHIPARFRESLGGTFVLTRGLDNCLFAFPLVEWAKLEEQLKGLPFTKADARAFTRFFFAGAAEVELDRQGRVVVPPHLREYAKLDRDVVVLGVSDRVEIWSKDVWDAYEGETDLSYEAVAEKIVDFGI